MPALPSHRLVVLALAAMAAIFASGAVLSAGTISGTVRGQGADEAGDDGTGGAYGSRRLKFVERIDYANLTDFVISIDDVAAPPPAGPSPQVAVIRQRDGTFVPHVLPVVAGTVVEWPNEDEIFHNVFSMSATTPFDLGLYKKDHVPRRVRFDQPGRVDVFCAIHARMNCVVLVLPNPWFARADERGRFVIRDVPPGTYRLRAWHERLPAKVQEITVPEAGEVRADFVLGPGGRAKS